MRCGTHPNVLFRKVPWLLGLLLAVAWGPARAQSGAADGQAPAPSQEQLAAERPLRLGLVLDSPHSRFDSLAAALQGELAALSDGAGATQWSPDKLRSADGTLEGARRAVEALLADPEVDLVIGFGVLASHALDQRVARGEPLPKPAVAPFVLRDAAEVASPPGAHRQGPTPSEGPRPRALEVSGPSDPTAPTAADPRWSPIVWQLDFDRDLAVLDELGVSGKVAWLGSRQLEAIDGLSEALQRAARRRGRELVTISVDRDVAAAVAAIPADAAAAYVGPNPQLDEGQLERLAAQLIERRLPSVAWLGEPMVERGLLAGLGTRADLQRLVRRVALTTRAIAEASAEGAAAPARRRLLPRDARWTINLATARALSLPLRWSLLIEAQVLHPLRQEEGAALTLGAAVQLALAQNVDLAALQREVAAGAYNVDLAAAKLKPRADASLTGVWIDADRAAFGTAERMAQYSLSATVPLYSERAWANLTVQRELSLALAERGQLGRLDVAWATARAYLALLGAQTAERVQGEQLATTREHLELARLRVETGVANPAEVSRWQSQIAAARRAVIDAAAARNVAEIQLNQLLARPLEEPLRVRETTLEETPMLAAQPEFRALLDSTTEFRRLRQQLVAEALAAAPEIAALGHSIEAKQRELLSNQRSYYAPDVALFGGVTHRFARGGQGSETPELPELPGGQPLPVPVPNDFDWQVGVSVQLPLFEGGRRGAAVDKNHTELSQLVLQKRSLERRIDQRVRAALHRAGASLAAVTLSRDAEAAALANLSVISDGYARGATNIVQLLDAQTQAQTAQLASAGALYAYLLDGVEVERAAGRLPTENDEGARQLLRRLSGPAAAPSRGAPPPAVAPAPTAPAPAAASSRAAPPAPAPVAVTP